MSRSRVEVLEEFVRNNPNDSFSRYGLAMEYANAGRQDEALAIFQELLHLNPDYAAAYYHAGMLLSRMGRAQEARRILELGLEVTKRIGDWHTHSELEAALHDLKV